MVREFIDGRPLCWDCLRLMARAPDFDHAGKLVFACGRCTAIEVVRASEPVLTYKSTEKPGEQHPLTP